MSDIIASGKNFVTGQNVPVKPGDKLVDTDGTVIGPASPFAAGTYANSVFGQGAIDPVDINTFASGPGSTATGAQGFAHGKGVIAGISCVSFGYGYPGYTGASAGYVSFSAGAGINVAGRYSFGQGGWYIDTRGDQIFAQGAAIYQTNATSRNLFTQGSAITVSGITYNSFCQGEAITTSNIIFDSFFQGRNIANSTDRTYSASVQGYDISITGGAYLHATLIQGRYITSTATIDINDSFIQGRNHTISGQYCTKNFIQGYKHTAVNPQTEFIAGVLNTSTSSGDCVQFGSLNSVTSCGDTFLHGRSNTATSADNCFGQGSNIGLTADRCFARGVFVNAIREDQTSWGSNRGTPAGSAQSCSINKHVQTTDDTQTTLITLDLEEDKSYSIVINVSARNTTTNAETASFVLNQACAYRDTAGVAVLVNTPVALTGLDSGGGAAVWSVDLASSGNNVLLRVTGDALDTVEWMAKLDFVEVQG